MLIWEEQMGGGDGQTEQAQSAAPTNSVQGLHSHRVSFWAVNRKIQTSTSKTWHTEETSGHSLGAWSLHWICHPLKSAFHILADERKEGQQNP